MTSLVLDPAEGAAKLIVGFFKSLGFIAGLLTSKSAAANVAGILLAIALFAVSGWFLIYLQRKGARARTRARDTRARSARRGKKDTRAIVLESIHDPSGRSSTKKEPEPPDTCSTASSKPDGTESAIPADESPDERASS